MKMATPQQEMEEFLTNLLHREKFVWDNILFEGTKICVMEDHFDIGNGFELDLEAYPCDVRKEFIQKVKLADIACLPITHMHVMDVHYELHLRDGKELPEGRAAIYEDIVEIILAFQSLPTLECTNVVGDTEPHKGHTTMCTLTEAAGSTSHPTQPNDSTRLTVIEFVGVVAPQMLKAACSLIAAPGSSIESVVLLSSEYMSDKEEHDTVLEVNFLEEMLSTHKPGGSYQAFEFLTFDIHLSWGDTSVKQLGEFLRCTPSIKKIHFLNYTSQFYEPEWEWPHETLAEALCFNNHVDTLGFDFGCPMKLQEAVVRVLMRDSQRHQPITALQHLLLGGNSYKNKSQLVQLSVEVIKMVECLKSLNIEIQDLDLKTIEALKFNHGLEHFTYMGAYNPERVDENALFSTIMDVLRVNYQLKEFGYKWENKYYEEALTKVFEERAINKPWEVMKDMALVPSTSARLFFCGYPYAGKTTLKNTIIESLNKRGESPKSTSKGRKIVHKTIDDIGMSSGDEVDLQDTYNRTRGIEVETTTLNNLHLTMWDMAGHDAYHPFHDLVISNIDGGGSSCCFLLVCNLFLQEIPVKQKKYTDVVNEIKYWLQFIASNTKKSILYHPHVKLVFTSFDQIKKFGRTVKKQVEEHVKPLQEQFKDTLNINEQPFYVNAHDVESIQPIVEELNATLSKLLPTLPHVFEACEELRTFLKEYKNSNPTRPLVKWEEFQVLCGKVSSLVVGDEINHEVAKKRREIVATSLHEAGEVIFYKDLNFVIINPHWFCHDVIGQVIACKDCGVLQPKMGLLSSTSLMCFLEESWAHEFDEDTNQDLLRLMMKLDLCFGHDNNNILIPASLCDDERNPSDSGARQLSWPTQKNIDDGVYVGRRVAPVNANLTMLTLGFFPRLQVSFQRTFENNEYTLKKNMISFIFNEMEIILEYSGYVGFHIDIFIRSQDPNRHAIYEFLTTHIIKHIFQECADPIRGCPGVVLEESIIRPSCVKDLVLCKYRLKQATSIQKLKEGIKGSNSLSFIHLWTREGDNLSSDYDKAMSLLSDKEQNDVLVLFSNCISAAKHSLMKHPYHETQVTKSSEKNDEELELKMQKMEINKCMVESNSRELIGIEHIQRQQQEFLKDIHDNFEKVILLLQAKFQELSTQSNVSSSNLSHKIDELLTFDVDLQKTHFPKFVWFKPTKPQTTKQAKKKIVNLLGTKYMVHLRCETFLGQHMHEIENQKGTLIKVENESNARFKKFLTYTLITLSTLISIGAHIAAPGMGTLVPEVAKGFLLVLDSPGLLDRGLKSITPSASTQPETILRANKEEAEKWLRDLLVTIDFKDAFGLYKVKYKNCGESINGRIAWVCEKCKIVEESQGKIEFLSCEL